MKNILKSSIWLILAGLVVINVFLFYSSIKLGDEITVYESKIESIHHDNLNLEKELSKVSSLYFAKNLAEKLKFTKKSQPNFLKKINYAFVPNQ